MGKQYEGIVFFAIFVEDNMRRRWPQNVAVCSLSVVFCLRLSLVCKSIMPVAEAILLHKVPLLLPSALPIYNLNNHVCVSVTVSIVLSHVCGTQL